MNQIRNWVPGEEMGLLVEQKQVLSGMGAMEVAPNDQIHTAVYNPPLNMVLSHSLRLKNYNRKGN